MRPGDFVLERDKGFVGWGIRLATRSRWNHAKLVITSAGDVLESLATGAEYGKVKPTDLVIEAPLTLGERALIPSIAVALHGTPYAFVDIAVLAFTQFGLPFPGAERQLARADRLFCSQLVDLAWSTAGFQAFDDGRIHGDVTPGDLGDLAFVENWRVLQAPDGYRIHS